MAEKAILVIDLGTSKVHANIISVQTGRLLTNATESYRWLGSEKGFVAVSYTHLTHQADRTRAVDHNCLAGLDVYFLNYNAIRVCSRFEHRSRRKVNGVRNMEDLSLIHIYAPIPFEQPRPY